MRNDLPICMQTAVVNRSEHAALKALAKGDASKYQQRLVLKLIIDKFARTEELSYIPGSQDQSAFLAGRAFVGKRLLKYMNSPVSESPEVQNNE